MSDFETHPVGTAKLLEWVNKEMFRRVKVENELWACAAGKRPLPTAEECKQWAIVLGVPEEFKLRPTEPVWTLPPTLHCGGKDD